MAGPAAAREAVCALRREIARIEGVLPEPLATPAGPACPAVGSVATGVGRLDFVLGGGVPRAALTEIHGAETRDAGAVAGFALALARLLAKPATAAGASPLLWIATAEVLREAGTAHAGGVAAAFGIGPDRLLLAAAPKLSDALWIAEEAARAKAFCAIVLEVRGNPAGLGLTATRRLHARAQAAGRPLLLVRQAGRPEPTAAPVRLVTTPAPAAPRRTLAGPLAGSIGRPAFAVAVGKSRTALPGEFMLEWNEDEHAFVERPAAAGNGTEIRPEVPLAVVPLSSGGARAAPGSGTVVAFRAAAAGGQPPRGQRPAHRRARREG